MPADLNPHAPLQIPDGLLLIMAAHPDDETIGVGSFLPAWASRAMIVHLTDGAPLNKRDAHAAGFLTASEYAAARRKEVVNALALAGVGEEKILPFGFPDQELAYCLEEAVRRLSELFRQVRPSAIFVHAYEGGHPDHDACSFVAAAAIKLCGFPHSSLFEYCSYHIQEGRMVSSVFLPGINTIVYSKVLSPDERALKQEMFDAFVTQRKALASFRLDIERIRQAPTYNYAKPPHSGKLLYECWEWGITGTKWRSAAQRAAAELEIDYCG